MNILRFCCEKGQKKIERNERIMNNRKQDAP